MSQGIKMFDGHNWIERKANARIFKNGIWQPAKVYLYTAQNEGWRLVSEQTFVSQWDCTWSQSYWGQGADRWGVPSWKPNTAKPVGGETNGNALYQGRFGNPDMAIKGDKGIQRGMFGFNDGDIRKALSGSKIKKVELYVHSHHWWYYAGGELHLGTHNASGWQFKFSEANYNIVSQGYTARDQGRWITLPNWVGDNLRDNKIKGFTTHIESMGLNYYGYMYGSQGGSKKPKLKITYAK